MVSNNLVKSCVNSRKLNYSDIPVGYLNCLRDQIKFYNEPADSDYSGHLSPSGAAVFYTEVVPVTVEQPASGQSFSSDSRAAATRTAVGLRRAVQHVSNLWFPVNPDLLLRVRKSLNEGRYDLDVDFLIEDLRPDLALFTHCIRSLSEMLAGELGVESPSRGALSVRELFKAAGNDRIKKVFSQEANQISSCLLYTSDAADE